MANNNDKSYCTEEYYMPGKSCKRIEEDHIARYLFAAKYARGKNVLDIACGVGYAAPLIIGAGALSYSGVDLNPNQINYASTMYGSDRISFETGDIGTYKSNTKYDLIICFETIEHVSKYKEALINLYTLLSSNGLLILSTPNRPVTSPKALTIYDAPANKYHTQEYNLNEIIIELIEVGFNISKQNIFGQRLKRSFNCKAIDIIIKVNPSPIVKPLNNKIARYHVIVAGK